MLSVPSEKDLLLCFLFLPVFTFKAKPFWARWFCVWCEERLRLSYIGTHIFSTSFEKIILVSLNYFGTLFRNQSNIHMWANFWTPFTPLSVCYLCNNATEPDDPCPIAHLKTRWCIFFHLFLRVSHYHWFSETWLRSAVLQFSLFCFGSLSCLYLWVCTSKFLHNVR